MLRLFISLLLVATTVSGAFAQIFNPVDWDFEAKRTSETEAELTFKASIEKGWHLYAQELDEGGPVPTTFTFQKLDGAKLLGKVSEGEGHVEMDPNFEMELKYFEDEASFVQKVEVSAAASTISGELEFMVCNDERCLPPDYKPFEFKVPALETGDVTPSEDGHGTSQIFDPVKWKFSHKDLGDGEYELQFTATIEKGWHLYAIKLPPEVMTQPTEFAFDSLKNVQLDGTVAEPEPITKFDPVNEEELSWFENEVTFTQKLKLVEHNGYVKGAVYFMACDDEKCLAPEWVDFEFSIDGELAEVSEEPSVANGNWWLVFLEGFFGGLVALLTPCVFPMIPLTVSFFTKQSKNSAQGKRNGILYGLSIVAIYTGLGVLVTMIFGKDALHALSTNTYFNLFLFGLLVVFAISFFGAFEITLPSSLANKLDQASEKRGGIVGILFMAATLSVVSFSCTGPIIGSVISIGGIGQITTTMFGFSVALGLPFALFAIFPGWLNSLPKSGGWLNAIKVSLGFVELAFAFKFLSNADLVEQWHLLERELFLAIWIACFAALTAYLFGFITMPHDSKVERLSVPRAMFGVTSLVFTLYLIPGLWGAPLKLISGFPPPDFYAETPYGLYKSGKSSHQQAASSDSESGLSANDGGHCPQNLNCFHDYETGLAYAKEVGKPVMLDFTGWACVNCRKMEEQVWSDSKVWKKLNEDFVIVSLYVDEKAELPKEERFYSEVLGKEVTRVGQKWVDFEISRFQHNSQPLYVVIDHDENQLGEPASYDPDVDKYIDWLDAGKAAFESTK